MPFFARQVRNKVRRLGNDALGAVTGPKYKQDDQRRPNVLSTFSITGSTRYCERRRLGLRRESASVLHGVLHFMVNRMAFPICVCVSLPVAPSVGSGSRIFCSLNIHDSESLKSSLERSKTPPSYHDHLKQWSLAPTGTLVQCYRWSICCCSIVSTITT
jgi:hypothetical protein